MRAIYLDDDVRDRDFADITPDDADEMRADYEHALAVARESITRRADLEERAKTDPDAALEVLRETFRRYNAAVKDGTESERAGWRADLHRACAQYNALTGRTRRSA